LIRKRAGLKTPPKLLKKRGPPFWGRLFYKPPACGETGPTKTPVGFKTHGGKGPKKRDRRPLSLLPRKGGAIYLPPL